MSAHTYGLVTAEPNPLAACPQSLYVSSLTSFGSSPISFGCTSVGELCLAATTAQCSKHFVNLTAQLQDWSSATLKRQKAHPSNLPATSAQVSKDSPAALSRWKGCG